MLISILKYYKNSEEQERMKKMNQNDENMKSIKWNEYEFGDISRYFITHETNFSDFEGKTIRKIKIIKDCEGDIILFLCADDCGGHYDDNDIEIYSLFHRRDCCETVYISDICGDLNDLVDTKIVKANLLINDNGYNNGESTTYSFYHITTEKGTVTFRWNGESNGDYSETVDFVKLLGRQPKC